MTVGVRRIIAANRNGKSSVISDERGLSNAFTAVRGFDPVVLWGTTAAPPLTPTNSAAAGSVLPPTGGTTLFVVTFPPDSVMMAGDFDPAAAGAEYMQRLPGLAERFELENPGMHVTPTVDYDIVLDGEIWCEFDDGKVVHMRRGDVMVQHGTRHAWRNQGSNPATLAFVLIGAQE